MTDTDDIEGKVIDFSDKRPKNIDIINVMSYFIGDIFSLIYKRRFKRNSGKIRAKTIKHRYWFWRVYETCALNYNKMEC